MFGTELLNIRKYILYYSKHLIINISFKYSVVYDIISGKLVIFSGSYRHCTFHVTLHYMYISAGQSHHFNSIEERMIQIVFELSKGRPLVKKLNDVISNWLIQTLVSSIFVECQFSILALIQEIK